MAGDFNKPTVSSTYTLFPTEVRDNVIACAKLDFEAQADANLVNGMMQYKRTTKRWQQRESGVWVDKELDGAMLADASVTEVKLADDAATRSTLLFEARNTQTGTNAIAVTSRSGAGTGTLQVAAKALKITHLSLVRMETGVTISAGSITATLYKGVTSTSQSITMSSGDPTGKAAAITAQSLVAGDDFHFRVSTSSLTYTGGLDGVWIQAWGHYTA